MASAKQIAWRKKFAKMSKAGQFKKKKPPIRTSQDYADWRKGYGTAGKKAKSSKSKLTASHKALIKKDVKANRELYTTNVTSLGGFDPSMLVDSQVYTKINRDFGNTRFNNNPTQEKVDDLIANYLLTLKLNLK